MTTTHPLDHIAELRSSRRPVPYRLTAEAERLLESDRPFCTEWVGTSYGRRAFRRPCLLPAGHDGDHDPRGGRSRNH